MGNERAATDTVPKLLIENARTRGNRVAMRHKDLGIWQSWTWSEMLEEVRAFSAGLEELGLKRGDKFTVIGANRPRLYWAMCAGQALGAIPVPVYADSVAEEMAYVLEHAEVMLAVVQDQEQVDKVLSIAERVPTLRHLADRVASRLRAKSRPGRTVTVRVRFADLRSVTRSTTLDAPIASTVTLAEAAHSFDARMVSLEHDPRFYDRTRHWLAESEHDVELRLAPLAGGWYARSGWEDLNGVLSDGPPNWGMAGTLFGSA